MPKTPESDFKERLRRYLDSQGIYWTNVQGGFGVAPGAPDMILCIDGKFIAFESKTYRGHLSDDQIIHKEKIEASGGLYFITKTLEQAKDIIDRVRSPHCSKER